MGHSERKNKTVMFAIYSQCHKGHKGHMIKSMKVLENKMEDLQGLANSTKDGEYFKNLKRKKFSSIQPLRFFYSRCFSSIMLSKYCKNGCSSHFSFGLE